MRVPNFSYVVKYVKKYTKKLTKKLQKCGGGVGGWGLFFIFLLGSKTDKTPHSIIFAIDPNFCFQPYLIQYCAIQKQQDPLYKGK